MNFKIFMQLPKGQQNGDKMQHESRGIVNIIENYVDMLINIIAIVAGYLFVLMIYEPIIELTHPLTIVLIFLNLVIMSFVYHAFGLYRQTRYMRRFHSLPEVLRANLVYFGGMSLIVAFVTRIGYKEFILFWLLFAALASTAMLTFKRRVIKLVVKAFRLGQYQTRTVIIVGDNTIASAGFVKEVKKNSQCGMKLLGFVGRKMEADEVGIDKLGSFEDLEAVLDEYRPSDVVFAIGAYDKKHLIDLVNICDDRCVKVYFLPVIYGFFKNSRQIEQIGALPMINIHSTPLDNIANAAIKRLVDIIGSALLIILTSPIMLVAAIGVKISSPGPIFFKQERVGTLGKNFTMLKFRSMRVNAGSDSTWTTDEDPRKTKFGNFIRRTSIDELPQLFNVLIGNMSLVGPRPEIPVFVDHFKQIIPLYMVKHYVKPGMTGLAQIKGLRGDTSVEDRIHEDIDYIENWSIMLDLYILFKTPFKAINKNEKYAGSNDSEGDSAGEGENE